LFRRRRGSVLDFSTLFHSRIKPQDSLFTLLALSIEGSFEGFALLALSIEGSLEGFALLALSIEGSLEGFTLSLEGTTLSSSAPCEAVLRTSPPHSNNYAVHINMLLTYSNFHATM